MNKTILIIDDDKKMNNSMTRRITEMIRAKEQSLLDVSHELLFTNGCFFLMLKILLKYPGIC